MKTKWPIKKSRKKKLYSPTGLRDAHPKQTGKNKIKNNSFYKKKINNPLLQ